MQQIFAKLKKNWSNEIWVTLSEFKGEERIDIREYYRPDDGPDYHPTKKGVSIPKSCVYELLKLIESIEYEDATGTIRTFEISDSVQIRASNREYFNRKYKEIRIYIFSNKNGQWIPTRKGITFNFELAQKLHETIKEAIDFISS